MVPRNTQWKPYRYRAPEYLFAKEQKRKIRYADRPRPAKRADSPSSSENSIDDDNQYENDEVFWNEHELIKMQLDEGSVDRNYVKLTVTRTNDKQDQDMIWCDYKVAKLAHPDVQYVYLLESLKVDQ